MFQTKKGKRSIFNLSDKSSSAMTTPFLDFLFVGGLSLILLPLVFILNIQLTNSLAIAAIIISYFVNQPHFIHSYQLLYDDYWGKLLDKEAATPRKIRLFLSGVLVPIGLFSFLLFSIISKDHNLLGYAAAAMFFLVGWHYVKQGYGILMTLSVRAKVFYSPLEKRVFLINAYVCWGLAWSLANLGLRRSDLLGIDYPMFYAVEKAIPLVVAITLLSTVCTVALFWLKYEKSKQFAFNGFVAYICAIYIWLVVVYTHPLLIWFFPVFHSLQYLLFVWKIKYEKERENGKQDGALVSKKMRNFYYISFCLGVFSFYIVPTLMDRAIGFDIDGANSMSYMFAFLVFINIHHYFIDFAIWRRDNPDMKYLFK